MPLTLPPISRSAKKSPLPWRACLEVCLLVFMILPPNCLGTAASGTLLGRVSDPTGAPVPGARVVVRNLETNATRESRTGAQGEYVAPLLPPGKYEISVEAKGFRGKTESGVPLDVDQEVRVDLVLQPGNLSQKIVVTAFAPLLDTQDATLGQVIDQPGLFSLPLNERNFLNFALLGPGVHLSAEGSQTSSQGVSVSVNGAREQANNFLMDGTDNNDPLNNLYSVLPPVDAIQEFKVQGSDSSAEFGRNAGAQVNVVLKSGTNNLHGSVFEYFRNRHLDAKNVFDQPDCTPGSVPGRCSSIPRFDRNQYGGALGGPIRRDKTFFFISYEGLNLRQATTREATVPSQAQRSATLAAVPPPARNPAGLAVFNLYPAANVGTNLMTSNLFVSTPSIRDTVNLLVVKIDHHLGSKDDLSGHYAFANDDRFNPIDPLLALTNLPGYGSFAKNRGQNLGITWTRVVTPRLTNQFRFGYNRRRGGIFQQSSGTDNNKALGFPDVLTNPQDLGFPAVLVAGFDSIGEPRNLPQDRLNNAVQFADSAAWNPGFQNGRHRLTFGADIRPIRLTTFVDAVARGEWIFLGVFTGNSFQDLLLGLPTFALGARGNTFTDLRTVGVNFFAQDDLRITDSLTLNFGVRWEFNRPPVDTKNRLSAPDLTAHSVTCSPKPDCQFITAGTGGLPRATYSSDLDNWAPRVGIAWRPGGSNRWVLRSGYGIFYDVGFLNANLFPRFNPPFYDVGLFFNGLLVGGGPSTIQTVLSQPPQPALSTLIDPGFRDSYSQQWNADVQYAGLRNMVFDLSYVGSKGTGLTTQRNLNQAPPGTLAFPFPQFGPIDLFQSTASSVYHALGFRAEKRFSRRLLLLAAYTWSKSIDNASALFGTASEPGFPQNSLDLDAERGLSNFDARHRFVLSAVHQLPFGKDQPWLRNPGVLHALLSGWEVSGILTLQSGGPFTVNRGVDQSHTGTAGLGIFADRPNVLADPFRPGPVAGNPSTNCPARVRSTQAWFNPCAFSDPGVAFGNAGRNILIGPNLMNLDFAVTRSIPFLREGEALRLRAEFFNLFNRPNFDLPDRSFDSPTFGQIRSANANGNKPPRQIQLSVRYQF